MIISGHSHELGGHLVRAEHYRNLRISAFTEWSSAVASRKAESNIYSLQLVELEPIAKNLYVRNIGIVQGFWVRPTAITAGQ